VARLFLREPAGGWRTVDLPGGELVVGRDDTSQVVVLERSISRRHARLVETEAGWCVYDEGSGNGTFVNGQRVRDALLRHGDDVRFGMVRGRFEEAPAVETPPAPRVPPPVPPPPPPPVAAAPRSAPPRLRAASPGRLPPLPAGGRRPSARRPSPLPAILALLVLGAALAGGAAFLLLRTNRPAAGTSARGAEGVAEKLEEAPTPLDAFGAVEAGDAGRLEALLDGGADPNEAGADGLILVQRAAWGGRTDVAELLVAKGADLFRRDPLGLTPAARAFAEGRCEVALLLVPKEPTPAAADGRTYLHRAANGGCANEVKALVALGAAVDAPDAAGLTPLHVAALGGRSEVLSALLEAGASAGRSTPSGRTPLHLASLAGRAEAAKALLARGADPNAKDATGRTPLHLAAASGDAETVSALLAAKADPSRGGPDGTPFDVALAWAAWDTAELLAPPGT
jgi:ankyrin repeat protein